MAKNKNETATVGAPAVSGDSGSASVVPAGVEAMSTRPPARASGNRPLPDQLVDGLADAAGVVRRVLPNRLPAYLVGGALLVVGVIEPPVALAGGLAYEALRRWRPSSTN